MKTTEEGWQDGVGLLDIAETPADLTAERVMRVAQMLGPEEPTHEGRAIAMEREAGPALDADIGQHVMGLIVQRWRDGDVVAGSVYLVGKGLFPTPAYSTTGDGMLLVIERMRAQPLEVHARFAAALDETVNAVMAAGDRLAWPEAVLWMTPHAVALAALAALEPNDGR